MSYTLSGTWKGAFAQAGSDIHLVLDTRPTPGQLLIAIFYSELPNPTVPSDDMADGGTWVRAVSYPVSGGNQYTLLCYKIMGSAGGAGKTVNASTGAYPVTFFVGVYDTTGPDYAMPPIVQSITTSSGGVGQGSSPGQLLIQAPGLNAIAIEMAAGNTFYGVPASGTGYTTQSTVFGTAPNYDGTVTTIADRTDNPGQPSYDFQWFLPGDYRTQLLGFILSRKSQPPNGALFSYMQNQGTI